MDATQKLEVITDLISKNNEILQEVDELSRWKKDAERWGEDAARRLKAGEQEKIASEVLAKRTVELETELQRQRNKYQKAMKALAGMEQALLTVETQRQKLALKNVPAEEESLEPWGCIEEENEQVNDDTQS